MPSFAAKGDEHFGRLCQTVCNRRERSTHAVPTRGLRPARLTPRTFSAKALQFCHTAVSKNAGRDRSHGAEIAASALFTCIAAPIKPHIRPILTGPLALERSLLNA
jgi:hypothetical protein